MIFIFDSMLGHISNVQACCCVGVLSDLKSGHRALTGRIVYSPRVSEQFVGSCFLLWSWAKASQCFKALGGVIILSFRDYAVADAGEA